MNVPEIHETTVSGVKTFWVDTPPPLTAVLGFRVGAWEETLRTRGITHLVEHLALFDQRGVRHTYNGAVYGDHTIFWAAGSPGDISRFLSGVTESLGVLPVSRLDTEAGVLRAEALRFASTPYTMILAALFGPNGPGLLNHGELGLGWLEPDAVQEWASRHFTEQNAVLMLSGPPPEELEFDLSQGVHRVYRAPSREGIHTPARTERIGAQPAGISIGGLVERSTEAVIAAEMVSKRLLDHLRHTLGLAYSIGPGYLPIDRDTALMSFGADCEPPKALRMASSFLDVLRDFARFGPTEAEMEHLRKPPTDDAIDQVAFARGELNTVGISTLLGFEINRYHDYMPKRHAAEPADIKEAFSAFLEHSVVIAPEKTQRLSRRAKRRDQPVAGTELTAGRKRGADALEKVVIGPDGISGYADARWVTIHWADVEMARQGIGGVWELHSRTGAWIRVNLGDTRRQRKVDRLLLDHLPAEAILPPDRQPTAVAAELK